MAPSAAVDPAVPGLPGGEPPAVISLLAGHLDETGYPATLLDLAARGWFGLRETGPGRLMCVLPATSPAQPLAPYEQRAALHLARRAAGRGEVPASALSEGFAEGQVAFGEAFHREVVADARRRGLIKPGLRGRTGLLLGAAALIPAGALAVAVGVPAHHARAFLPVLCWLVLIWLIGAGVRGSERPTPAGRALLSGWQHRQAALPGQATAAPPGPGTGAAGEPGLGPDLARQAADGDRAVGYAAALGAAPTAVSVFTRDKSLVWSSYGGHWRQIRVGDPGERSMPGAAGLIVFAALGLPAFVVLLFLGTLAVRGFTGGVMVLAAIGIAATGLTMLSRARRADALLPASAELNAVVLERWTWVETSDEGGETTYYGVALDDGRRDQAWAFTVSNVLYARLVPGTLVHAVINPRRNRLLSAEITGRPQLPPQVAAAEVAKQPLRYRLVKAAEAARVLGVPESELQCYLLGWSCLWKWSKGRRSLTLTSGRRAMLARHAERTGRRLPSPDGVEIWQVGRHAVLLRRGEMVVKIVVPGRAVPGKTAMLGWLAERVAERLAAAPGDEILSEDEWAPAPEGS